LAAGLLTAPALRQLKALSALLNSGIEMSSGRKIHPEQALQKREKF
jgi:hypothetical protein